MSKSGISKKVDVLILGGGVAGAVAAAALAKRGVHVAIVDRTGGATGQSSGAVDVAHSHNHSHESVGYVDAARFIAKNDVHHPYSKLGEQRLGLIESALTMLKEIARDLDFVARSDERNMLLATQLGTIKHSAMVQQTQAFDLNDLSPGDLITLVGFSGLPAFDARAVARMLSWSMSRALQKDVLVETLQVNVQGSGAPWRSVIEMARAMDEKNTWNALESAMRKAIPTGNAGQRIFLIPPILGRTHYRKYWHSLNAEENTRVYELLAMPHSMPGQRLKDAIARGLQAESIEIIDGEAVNAECTNGSISQVIVNSRNEHFEIKPRSVILATGRFFSGGFERQGFRREKIFGLPLWHEGKALEDTHVAAVSNKGISNDQPIFSAGLSIDERQRPHDRMMELFALNLFAAGSSIGGYDSGGVSSGLGLAAVTGYVSALHAFEGLSR